MFAMKNTEENSGERYKLSSDVGACIFVPWHFAKSTSIAQTNFMFLFPLYAMTVQCRIVGVWGIKAMFSDNPSCYHI